MDHSSSSANKKIFWVLEKIKEKQLLSPKGEAPPIWVSDFVNQKINLTPDEVLIILRKLEQLNVIGPLIQHPDTPNRDDLSDLYFLTIDDRKFIKLYKKHEDNEYQKAVEYIFEKYNQAHGKLIIKNKEIEFKKTPSLILNFFYLNKNFNEFYNYKNFNEFIGPESKQITSDFFQKSITKINNNIYKKTKNLVKNLIIKKETKNKTTNQYKWNPIFKQ